MERLETERLVLRRPAGDDVPGLLALVQDEEVMRYVFGRALSQEEGLSVIRSMLERWEDDGFGLFAVERKEDGALLGELGLLVWESETWTPTSLARASGPTEIEIGWTLARDAWGHGYATEGARAVVDWAFAELRVRRLVSLIHPDNTASIRLAEKLGERYERDVETGSEKPTRLYALEA